MSAPSIHPDVAALAEAAEVTGPAAFRLLGEARELPVAPGADPREALLPALESALYVRLYTRPAFTGSAPGGPLAMRDHTNALSAANTGRGTWEAGWRVVEREEDGRIAVVKDRVTFWVMPDQLRTPSGTPAPGTECRVWVGKEMRHLVPGFYFAYGDRPGGGNGAPLVRLYWALTAASAAPYMAALTAGLNQARVPFRTKVVGDPGGYHRADAGVLYLERRHYREAAPVVARVHAGLAGGGLRPVVPMFTRELAPGLGVAEDPGGGQSFGQARCSVAARALAGASARGETGAEARAAAIARAFAEQGLDPARPHLNPGSTDVYTLSAPPADRRRGAPSPTLHRAARR